MAERQERASAAWMAAMRRGDVRRAFALSDAVLAARDPGDRDDPRLPYHRRWLWTGRRVDGADVLVRCYHGLGDTVQFARFLPLLRARARSLRVEAQAELLPLLAPILGSECLDAFHPDCPLPTQECEVEIMEVAHALRVDPRHVPPPYLPLPQDGIAAARACLAMAARPWIGLCWRAGAWKPARSLALPAVLPAVAGRGSLINLQADASPKERALARFAGVGACPSAVMDTATLISVLDVVVTVDTLVAHLAGALARPTCLLLGAEPDWRWCVEAPRSIWYPDIERFVQSEQGRLEAPMALLSEHLDQRLGSVAED